MMSTPLEMLEAQQQALCTMERLMPATNGLPHLATVARLKELLDAEDELARLRQVAGDMRKQGHLRLNEAEKEEAKPEPDWERVVHLRKAARSLFDTAVTITPPVSKS